MRCWVPGVTAEVFGMPGKQGGPASPVQASTSSSQERAAARYCPGGDGLRQRSHVTPDGCVSAGDSSRSSEGTLAVGEFREVLVRANM